MALAVVREPANEFVRNQCHCLVSSAPVLSIVFPFEGDAAVVVIEQVAVTDGDPVGIA